MIQRKGNACKSEFFIILSNTLSRIKGTYQQTSVSQHFTEWKMVNKSVVFRYISNYLSGFVRDSLDVKSKVYVSLSLWIYNSTVDSLTKFWFKQFKVSCVSNLHDNGSKWRHALHGLVTIYLSSKSIILTASSRLL